MFVYVRDEKILIISWSKEEEEIWRIEIKYKRFEASQNTSLLTWHWHLLFIVSLEATRLKNKYKIREDNFLIVRWIPPFPPLLNNSRIWNTDGKMTNRIHMIDIRNTKKGYIYTFIAARECEYGNIGLRKKIGMQAMRIEFREYRYSFIKFQLAKRRAVRIVTSTR